MRKSLCTLNSDGQVVHVFEPRRITRRVGWPWRESGRLITIGWKYVCGRCGETGYAA